MDSIQPLVSICSITYNHAPYIRQCLDGFLMQKTTFPIEIIINDDCSTDGTTDIIREYETKYPDIVKPIYHAENEYSKGVRGMFATYCFPKAKGKYVAMCEGDDFWIDPLKLQKQVDFLENNPEYGLVYSQVEAFDGDEIIGPIAREVTDAKSLLYGNVIATLTVCARNELLHSYLNEVRPHNKKWLMGDYPMWLWISLHSKLHFFEETMGRYRVLQNSASHSTDLNKVVLFEDSVLDVKLFYIKKFWHNDKVLLEDVYAISTWYVFRLYMVNHMEKQAFRLFFKRYKMLSLEDKKQGLRLWLCPIKRKKMKRKWKSYTKVFN